MQMYSITSASVKDANAAISSIMDLVEFQVGVAIGFDPNTSHSVIKDLIVLQDSKSW